MTQVINQNPPLKFPQGKTILLADDDENCVLLVTIICRKYNIKVVAAENGQQALELASQNNIDLIITDVNMPVLSGLEFTRRLKTIPKVSEIPVIAVTANTMIDEVHNIHDAGFSEILFKPFREKEIIEKISLFLQ
jgi:CheY-like chemotaxis protein